MKKNQKKLVFALLVFAGVVQGETSTAQATRSSDRSSGESIRPFKFHASQADLDDLKHRIQTTNGP
jgi:hypothetical protein